MNKYALTKILRRTMRSKTTHVLLISHVVVWVLLVVVSPPSWAVFFAICALSFLFTAVFVGYKQAQLYSAMNTYDRIFTPAMQIANKALPFLRTGLNEQTAAKVAEIIKEISGASAVAITDSENVLAYLGTGYENHPPGEPIVTQATQDVIRYGKLRILRNKKEFQCTRPNCSCPLQSAVIAPLTYKGRVAGTVKLYLTQKGDVPDHFIKLAYGMAELLSMQIELAEIDYQTHLAVEAKLDALQAQINPHFLFNTLNTIGALIRINPSLARSLLYRFSSYFRYSLKEKGRFVTVREELEFIRNYLILEKARFGRKLRLVQCVDPCLKDQVIPILSLQPLIENAIRHGVTPKESAGTVKITVRRLGDEAVELSVLDDGVGINPEILPYVLEPGFGTGSGVGMSNVNQRLKMIYGEENGLIIASTPGEGTEVKFIIPRQIQNSGSEIHEA
ncbi:MAG TPA: histidine kinase [Clostridiales bacterium]|jgi:LytS/YehU family sensor histidine kinase|nr:histidine kinase [Clostridiales bacterium]